MQELVAGKITRLCYFLISLFVNMLAKGRLLKTTMEQAKQIAKMKASCELVSTICRIVNVSWPTVYRVLRRVEDGDIKVA
jgi:DNA invertase Pin-like site-specific DNA recombinase